MITASIVLYNHRKEHVWPAISSLLATEAVTKIVLVDNSGNCHWAQETNEEKIVYIKAEHNGGYGYGHNLAIKQYAAQNKYYLICNPDIFFKPEQLTALLDYAENGQYSAGLYMPDVHYPDGSRQELCRLLPNPIILFLRRFVPSFATYVNNGYLLRHADFSKPFYAPSLSGCFMFFRSQALIELGGFDERYFMYMEDVDLSRRAAIKYGALYVPYAVITHQFERASYKNRKLMYAHIKSAIKYFKKWGWFFDREKQFLNRRCIKDNILL